MDIDKNVAAANSTGIRWEEEERRSRIRETTKKIVVLNNTGGKIKPLHICRLFLHFHEKTKMVDYHGVDPEHAFPFLREFIVTQHLL